MENEGLHADLTQNGSFVPQNSSSLQGQGTSAAPTTSLKVSQAEKEVQHLIQGCTFTKDQYDHILKMMQQKSDVTSPSMCNTANTCKHSFVSKPNQMWIIDTGATNHMVSSLDMMIKGSVSQLAESKPVYLPNGSTTQQDDPAWSQVPVHPALSLDPAFLNSESTSDCRRSTRQKHTPTWMKDFVSLSMNMKIPYPLCNSMSYDHLSPIY
ncbi:hypothetical protein KY290_012112 [Solanum tuberosum]|uniref:Uncharacterized protein n=1 Tax=Solanum tuberosum TaxID=4113 RepID=A0ABQ7W4Q7_SOLTU|nr:hypothetical protein KY289_010487 [Solanum tuberosum]KAH0774975.1 hypothetical protein KY290_012112 [Solanum tuberosum]